MNNLLTAKIFRIIELVAASPRPVSLKSLREQSGISGAVVSRIVADMVELGILEKSGYHEVVPSLGIMRLNLAAESSIPLIRKLRPVLTNRLPSLGVCGSVFVMYKGAPLRVFDLRGEREFNSDDDFRQAAFYAAVFSLPQPPDDIPVSDMEERFSGYDFSGMVAAFRRDGFLIHQSGSGSWEVYAPFLWYGGAGTLIFYGNGLRSRQELMLTAGECRRLSGRLSTLLGSL